MQEMIIPVLLIRYPKKARKIDVMLRPISQIVSPNQTIEIAPGTVQKNIEGGFEDNILGRQIYIEIIDPKTEEAIFISKSPINIEPAGEIKTLELAKVEGISAIRGVDVEMRVIDFDDGEILDRRIVSLAVDLDEWC
jgi:hypothetical protein